MRKTDIRPGTLLVLTERTALATASQDGLSSYRHTTFERGQVLMFIGDHDNPRFYLNSSAVRAPDGEVYYTDMEYHCNRGSFENVVNPG